MKTSEIFLESLKIRNNLKSVDDFEENKIDETLNPVLPFRINNKIKLIILGQDPTVKNAKSRTEIEYTLNLDKNGSLKTYIQLICNKLEIDFENIYATNVIKYFYTRPPADTFHVLQNHLNPNLDLLINELKDFKRIPIITLGEPVLKLLTDNDNVVKKYWGYYDDIYKYCSAQDNKLNRGFFPFPHQPSLTKTFYKNKLDNYLEFVKSEIKVK